MALEIDELSYDLKLLLHILIIQVLNLSRELR
jgi:hypothetical protein